MTGFGQHPRQVGQTAHDPAERVGLDRVVVHPLARRQPVERGVVVGGVVTLLLS